MARKYEKVQKLLPVVQQMVEEGYTQREIAEKLGLSGKQVVKKLLERSRKKTKGIRKAKNSIRKKAKRIRKKAERLENM